MSSPVERGAVFSIPGVTGTGGVERGREWNLEVPHTGGERQWGQLRLEIDAITLNQSPNETIFSSTSCVHAGQGETRGPNLPPVVAPSSLHVNYIKELIDHDWHGTYGSPFTVQAGQGRGAVLPVLTVHTCMCAHGAHMHVSRGKSLSGVPVNRLLFSAERKTCPNWFSSKNRIIPFHLITCPLHRVQASLHFSPQLSLRPSMWCLSACNIRKKKPKKRACWEQRACKFIRNSPVFKRNAQSASTGRQVRGKSRR